MGQDVMKEPKILILNSKQACDVGEKLLWLLLSASSTWEAHMLSEPINLDENWTSHNGPLETVNSFHPNIILLALSSDALGQARAMLSALRQAAPLTPLVVVLESGEPDEILALLNLGVSDFITLPLKAIDIIPRIQRLLDQASHRPSLTQTLKEKLGFKQMIGESAAFQAEIRKVPLVAKCDASVLITGETGTGKELCARALHYLSPRSRKPFVPVNCGAIPTDLVENELFGHERGAYTGAASSEQGIIQEADGGTIFFDEIDCLPTLAQVKLLRFLQEKEYRPLGSARTRKANVRVIAATNSDLEKTIREGRLRQDLYYRLNIIPLVLPPLRERREDIPLLAQHFLIKYALEFDKQVSNFSAEAIQTLLFYHWPGNVRELEHVVQRAVVLCETPAVRGLDIVIQNLETPPAQESFYKVKAKMVAQFEKHYIQQLLQACQGNITRAAQMAQKNRRAFWQLIRKHRIDVQAFKTGA